MSWGGLRICTVHLAAVVLLRRIAPGMLSIGVIHSVENLHACDLVKLAMVAMQDAKRGPVEKFL